MLVWLRGPGEGGKREGAMWIKFSRKLAYMSCNRYLGDPGNHTLRSPLMSMRRSKRRGTPREREAADCGPRRQECCRFRQHCILSSEATPIPSCTARCKHTAHTHTAGGERAVIVPVGGDARAARRQMLPAASVSKWNMAEREASERCTNGLQ